MAINLADLLAALAGGLFGAAIGALPAFIMTGFAVLVGVAAAFGGSSFDFVGTVAFGPFFGPHISFAGGVAAAAYAARREKLASGKDIASGLAGLGDPGVLAVGAVFGGLGYLVQAALAAGVGGYTDTVALTVVLSALTARLAFGRSGAFGTPTPEAAARGRFSPGGDQVWVPWMQDWAQVATIGLGAGLLSAWAYLKVAAAAPELAGLGVIIGFGISAVKLVFLQFGTKVPVTHHITLIAALAASITGSLWIGALFGVLSALLGEVQSRLFQIHGDTHIDPPANAIWVMTLVLMVMKSFI